MSLLMSYIYSFFFFELLCIQSYVQSSHVMFYIAVKAAQNFKWYFMKFYQHPQILLSLNLCTTITVFVFSLFPYSYAQFYQTVLSFKLHKLLNLFTLIKLGTYSIIWDFIEFLHMSCIIYYHILLFFSDINGVERKANVQKYVLSPVEKYTQEKIFQFQVKCESQTGYSCPNILSKYVSKSSVTHVFAIPAIIHYGIFSSVFSINQLEMSQNHSQ